MTQYPILSSRLRRVLNELEDLTNQMEKLESDPFIPFEQRDVFFDDEVTKELNGA